MKFIKNIFLVFCVLLIFLIFLEVKVDLSEKVLPQSNLRLRYLRLKRDVTDVLKMYMDNFFSASDNKDVTFVAEDKIESFKNGALIMPPKKKAEESDVPEKEKVSADDKPSADTDGRNDYNSIGFAGYSLKADALAVEGHYKESLEFYDKALAIEPDSASCLYNRATVYLKLKYYDKAVIDYTTLIAQKTENSDVYFNRAMAFYYLNEHDSALIDCNYLITKDERKYFVYFLRGNVYVAKAMYSAAISDYTQAVKLAPEDAGIYYNRAVAYEYVGKDNLAIEDYNKAIALDSSHQKAVESRERLYKKNGFSDDARKTILEPKNMFAK